MSRLLSQKMRSLSTHPLLSVYEKGTKTASIDLLIEIAVYGWVTLDYLILRQSLAAVQVKENIRMMREALNVFEQSL